MKRCLFVLFLLFTFVTVLKAQLVDKYGVNIGLNRANQLWHYDFFNLNDENKDYKFGFSIFLEAEKKLNSSFAVRSEIGYLQKGFKDNFEWFGIDGPFETAGNKNLILHDLGLGIALKISPLKGKWSPYGIIGLRGDYILDITDVAVVELGSGLSFNPYSMYTDEFNKLNIGALIGIGIEIIDKYYFEFEYNPALNKIYSDNLTSIKDNYLALKFGINISHLRK